MTVTVLAQAVNPATQAEALPAQITDALEAEEITVVHRTDRTLSAFDALSTFDVVDDAQAGRAVLRIQRLDTVARTLTLTHA